MTNPGLASSAKRFEVLLGFGAAMLRAGSTASRVRACMGEIVRKLGVDALSVNLQLGSITATVRRGTATVREIGPPGVDVGPITILDRFAWRIEPGLGPRQCNQQFIAALMATEGDG